MLGTRDIINEMLQKRRDAAKVEGREEMREEFLAWVERRDAARENDEPFDEPPPSSDKS